MNNKKRIDPLENERTSIEDLDVDGYELGEEQLRLITGGRMKASAGTCSPSAACDDD